MSNDCLIQMMTIDFLKKHLMDKRNIRRTLEYVSNNSNKFAQQYSKTLDINLVQPFKRYLEE